MEESKIDWHETYKIDRVCRVHTQRASYSHSQSFAHKSTSSRNHTPCKYFQKGMCSKKTDHEVNGITYLHVCQICFSQGKSHKHSSNECKSCSKKRVRHCSYAVQRIVRFKPRTVITNQPNNGESIDGEYVVRKNKYWPLLAINEHDVECETTNAVYSSSEM